MRILAITAGAARMYCGSCLRDNALAAEMMRQGHDVTLVPIYTPTRTDEPNVSMGRVLYGGVNVYLQQLFPFFRKTPWFLDRFFDSGLVMSLATRLSMATDPQKLGELTISTLQGEAGNQKKEVKKLLHWLESQPRPDVVVLPNSMMIGLAKPVRRALDCPVACTLQGEDLFLDGLPGDLRTRAIDLIRDQVGYVDGFIAISQYYADYMGSLLAIPREKMSVVPLGINLEGFEPREHVADGPVTIGFFARIAPEKGLHNLTAAYRLLRQREDLPPMRLAVAGYLGRQHRGYLSRIEREVRADGFADEFRYHGELERSEKIEFLKSLDVLSVPSDYKEPKGLFLLEAMASGVPVVQPNHGAYPEIIDRTGGGHLVPADSIEGLAEGLAGLVKDVEKRREIGGRAAAAVRDHYSVERMAERALETYQRLSDAPVGVPVASSARTERVR